MADALLGFPPFTHLPHSLDFRVKAANSRCVASEPARARADYSVPAASYRSQASHRAARDARRLRAGVAFDLAATDSEPPLQSHAAADHEAPGKRQSDCQICYGMSRPGGRTGLRTCRVNFSHQVPGDIYDLNPTEISGKVSYAINLW
jgi:hypothetical protein